MVSGSYLLIFKSNLGHSWSLLITSPMIYVQPAHLFSSTHEGHLIVTHCPGSFFKVDNDVFMRLGLGFWEEGGISQWSSD